MNTNPLERTTVSQFATNFARFTLVGCVMAFLSQAVTAQESTAPANLAFVAKPSASNVSGDTSLAALNDGVAPRGSRDNRNGSYGNWPSTGTQWVEYDWSRPISTKQIDGVLVG